VNVAPSAPRRTTRHASANQKVICQRSRRIRVELRIGEFDGSGGHLGSCRIWRSEELPQVPQSLLRNGGGQFVGQASLPSGSQVVDDITCCRR
jgi:hypothetical protein